MRALLREYRIAYLQAALRHLHPLHVDVPSIVITLAQLISRRKQ